MNNGTLLPCPIRYRPVHATFRRGLFTIAHGLTLLWLLGACGSTAPSIGVIGYGQGLAVVADEQNAAWIAENILREGGTAADAAVALAFALTVSLPSSAGIGGGGVCLVHDHKSMKTEALEFFAGSGTTTPNTSRPSAIPALVRGMSELHAMYGNLKWELLVAPAENLARTGSTVSQALAKDLAVMGNSLLEDPEAHKILARPEGGVLAKGEKIIQADLANLLGKIRLFGADEFYIGPSARTLVDAVKLAGGSLSVEDLRGVKPRWRTTVQVRFDDSIAHFAPPPAAGGLAAQMWAMLSGDGGYLTAPQDSRSHLIAETELRSLADRSRWMLPGGESRLSPAELVSPTRIASLSTSLNDMHHIPIKQIGPGIVENPAATGFVVADTKGSVVACNLTLNNLFGIGRVAPGTGVLLAAAPDTTERGPYALASMIVLKKVENVLIKGNTTYVTFAATGVGGAPAAAAMINVAALVLISENRLVDAIAAPRVHSSIAADVTLIEKSNSPAMNDALETRGHTVSTVDSLGRVNVLNCPNGLLLFITCSVSSDPRASE